MKKLSRSAVSTVRMVAGNEKKHSIVIEGGKVREWIGFGWIELRDSIPADKEKYPTVEDFG